MIYDNVKYNKKVPRPFTLFYGIQTRKYNVLFLNQVLSRIQLLHLFGFIFREGSIILGSFFLLLLCAGYLQNLREEGHRDPRYRGVLGGLYRVLSLPQPHSRYGVVLMPYTYQRGRF